MRFKCHYLIIESKKYERPKHKMRDVEIEDGNSGIKDEFGDE